MLNSVARAWPRSPDLPYRLTRGAAKPDLRASGRWMERGTAGVRIELRVPSDLVLLSQFDMWEYVLLGQVVALVLNGAGRISHGDHKDHGEDGGARRMNSLSTIL